jgi:hypothetical protein
VDAADNGALLVQRVIRDASHCGFTTPEWIATLPPVDDGRYEITVLAQAEANGCGGLGSEILLWTFAHDQKMYSSEAVAWPGNGRTTALDAHFSSSAPDGAAPPMAEFSGEISDRNGRNYPPGTRIEAYVGRTRCGVASVRRTGNFAGYILSTVGPDSIPGCDGGATVTFRVDGRRAPETAVNELGGGKGFDLTV